MSNKQTNRPPIIAAQSLTPSDVLHRSKHLVDHAGVYIGNGEVIHNIPGQNISVVSLKEFSDGKIVRVTRSHLDPEVFSKQLEKVRMLSKKYSVFGFNCEHLMNLLIAKKAYSPQLKAGAVVGVVAAGLALHNKCSIKQAAVMAGVGALLGVAITNSLRSTDGIVAL